MSLWFVSAAILPEIVAEGGPGPGRAAALSSAVQIGFVAGALALAVHGTADRFDPRLVIEARPGRRGSEPRAAGDAARRRRAGHAPALTGAGLAGVYPVGMKLAGRLGHPRPRRAGGPLVGAITVGSALPHLLAFIGGADWRATVVAPPAGGAGGLAGRPRRSGRTTSGLRASIRARCGSPGPTSGCGSPISATSATCGSSTLSGPGSAPRRRLLRRPPRRPRHRPRGSSPLPRSPSAGCSASRPAGSPTGSARRGWRGAMVASGAAGLATSLAFGGPAWLVAPLVLLWGAAVIPDFGAVLRARRRRRAWRAGRQPAASADRPGLHADLLHRAGGALGRRGAGLAGDPCADGARAVGGIAAMRRLIALGRLAAAK